MATIKDVIDEFRTVSELDEFVTEDLNSFEYQYEFEVNSKQNRQYKLLLVSKRHPATTELKSRFWRRYAITMQLYDEYKQAEQQDTPLEEKRGELETLLENVIEKFRTRNQSGANGDFHYLEEEPIQWDDIDKSKNDNLVGKEAKFTVRVFGECT